jgi:hypothetical protein
MRIILSVLVTIMMSQINAQDVEAKLGGKTASETFDVKDSDGTTLLRVQGDGKVGIGTTIPNTWLDVNGIITSTGGNSTNWNTAFSWGDHSTESYLKTETDPIYTTSPASGITSGNIANWNTAYSWGEHSSWLSSNIYINTETFGMSPSAGGTFYTTVDCDDNNDIALSGGWNTDTSEPIIWHSFPADNKWVLGFKNTVNDTITIIGYCKCLRVD